MFVYYKILLLTTSGVYGSYAHLLHEQQDHPKHRLVGVGQQKGQPEREKDRHRIVRAGFQFEQWQEFPCELEVPGS